MLRGQSWHSTFNLSSKKVKKILNRRFLEKLMALSKIK